MAGFFSAELDPIIDLQGRIWDVPCSMAELSPRLRIQFLERRSRIRPPWTLIVFGTIYAVMPFLNYFGLSNQLHIPWSMPALVFRSLHPLQIILLIAPLFVGIGLLFVQKWGWWLCLVYSVCIVAYNIGAFLFRPGWYNAGALAQTILGTAAVFYFVQRDIAAPYMKMYPRGWRGQKRRPVEITVHIDNDDFRTRDVSGRGLYALWPECDKNAGDAVKINFELGGKSYALDAGIVRIDEEGVGIAFRGTDRQTEKEIARAVHVLEEQ